MSNSEGFQGCYVFKSRLQEYAQKVGLTIPVYETIKEGPSHEPKFRSTVIVNDVRYDSLPGFFNRKAAEHSAAEVALIELAKLDEGDKSITMPVNQTGLCKNLLQEYAQKMNFAVPNYECRKEEKSGVRHLFSCTVDVGGIKYIGATAGTKKEAEIKAARTALLAIRSTDSGPNENLNSNSTYTVVPGRKTGTASTQEAAAAALKPKKGKFKKNPRRNRRVGARGPIQANNVPDSLLSVDGNGGQPSAQANEVVVQTSDPAVLSQEAIRPTVNGNDQAHNVPDSLLSVDGNGGQPSAQANVVVVQTSDPAVLSQEAIMKLDDQRPTVNGNEGFAYSTDDAFASHHNIDYDPSGGQLTVFNHNQDIAASHGEISLSNIGDGQGYGVEQAACLVNNPPMCLEEVPRVVDGMN